MTKHIAILILALFACSIFAFADKIEVQAPDFDDIKQRTTDENSEFYYPKLLKKYFQDDSTMTDDQFRYLYYGAMFQEDYDPYRAPYREEELKELTPLYGKTSHSRHELDRIRTYAIGALKDNPLDIVQLKNLVYVYEKSRKVNLAQIWKFKLNHLLRTIASSGNGQNEESAWFISYPRHEFDFLNISGISVLDTEFVEPYFEKVHVNGKSDKDEPIQYYFNLQPVLERYYLKHPSE